MCDYFLRDRQCTCWVKQSDIEQYTQCCIVWGFKCPKCDVIY